jgi:hypothetical protein
MAVTYNINEETDREMHQNGTSEIYEKPLGQFKLIGANKIRQPELLGFRTLSIVRILNN